MPPSVRRRKDIERRSGGARQAGSRACASAAAMVPTATRACSKGVALVLDAAAGLLRFVVVVAVVAEEKETMKVADRCRSLDALVPC